MGCPVPVVSDASLLIWLAKIGEIALLKELFGEVIIPEEVYREAVEKGLQEGFSDALIIKECVDQGWIRLCRLDENGAALCLKIVKHAFEIHLGEAQAIVLSRNLGVLLLMDESSGRAFAETWSLKVKGTLYVIMRALREGLLDKTRAKEIVFGLVKKGFRIDPKLLARIVMEIEAFTPRDK